MSRKLSASIQLVFKSADLEHSRRDYRPALVRPETASKQLAKKKQTRSGNVSVKGIVPRSRVLSPLSALNCLFLLAVLKPGLADEVYRVDNQAGQTVANNDARTNVNVSLNIEDVMDALNGQPDAVLDEAESYFTHAHNNEILGNLYDPGKVALAKLAILNLGPGSTTVVAARARVRPFFLGWFRKENPGTMIHDYRDPFCATLPAKMAPGETIMITFPIEGNGILDPKVLRVGIEDSFSRFHWAPRKDLKKARRECASLRQ